MKWDWAIVVGEFPVLDQVVVRNASMKNSAWLTANASVIRIIVVKDRKTDIFLPQ